jgi:hypothetical protein
VIGILSNSQDATANFFQEFVSRSNTPFVRIDTDRLGDFTLNFHISDDRKASASFAIDDQICEFDELNALYYRRPKPPSLPAGLSPELRAWIESEYRRAWGGLLEGATKAKWVNHPFAISAASYKPEQLIRAKNHGVAVPDTIVTTSPSTARSFCQMHDWDIVVKPLGYGEIRNDGQEVGQVVYTNVLDRSLDPTLSMVANCPTLFQKHLSKEIDIRATVIGSTCIAVALHSQENSFSAVDCRRNDMVGMRYSPIVLPTSVRDSLLSLTSSYRLYFAAIDLVLDREGSYWFLELNPSGQWAWLEQLVGVPICAALLECLCSK